MDSQFKVEVNEMTRWEIQDSIYYHKPGPFMDLVINIDNRSASVSDPFRILEKSSVYQNNLVN